MQNLRTRFNAAARRKRRLAERDQHLSIIWTLTLMLIEEQNKTSREVSRNLRPPTLG